MARRHTAVDASTTSSTMYSSRSNSSGLEKFATEYATPPSSTMMPQMRNVDSNAL